MGTNEKYIRLRIETKDGNARIVFCKGDTETPTRWKEMETSEESQSATFCISSNVLDKFLIDIIQP